ALAGAERHDLLGNHGIRYVHAVDRHLGGAEGIGKTERLQRADHGVVQAALADDADVGHLTRECFVELLFLYEANGSRPAHVDLLLLLQVSRRLQADTDVAEVRLPAWVALR